MRRTPPISARSASIYDFIGLKPPTFHHSIEPLDADDWLRSITHKLLSVNVAEGDKVTYAAYHLEGPASLWWQNYEAMLPAGQIPTWRDFTEAFASITFLRLSLSAREKSYVVSPRVRWLLMLTEFENLARYATEEVSTDAKK